MTTQSANALAAQPMTLLQSGGAFFSALIADIHQARQRVWIETYIFDFTESPVKSQDPNTTDVAQALMTAAQRGVQVRLLVDGVGTGPLPSEWQQRLTDAGVHCQQFSPLGWTGLLNPVRWRRLHRKLCVVDEHIAYCGGINFLDDFYDPNHGTLSAARFDFGMRLQGIPAVDDVAFAMAQLWQRIAVLHNGVQAARQAQFSSLMGHAQTSVRALMPARNGDSDAPKKIAARALSERARLLLRDNFRNRTRIERAYRQAIGAAQHEIIIANAYFLPGFKLQSGLVHAARRGVKVTLLLQGRYEYFMQYHAARPVYGALLAAGVEIYEYEASFLHAKVAVVDAGHPNSWATVGSSNLDPLSLLLAREANLEVRDDAFASELRTRLCHAMENGGKPVQSDRYLARPVVQRVLNWLAYGLMRLALLAAGKRY